MEAGECDGEIAEMKALIVLRKAHPRLVCYTRSLHGRKDITVYLTSERMLPRLLSEKFSTAVTLAALPCCPAA